MTTYDDLQSAIAYAQMVADIPKPTVTITKLSTPAQWYYGRQKVEATHTVSIDFGDGDGCITYANSIDEAQRYATQKIRQRADHRHANELRRCFL